MARFYASRKCWLEADDLEQWAALGFVRGWDTFDPKLGAEQIGFALWKAKKSILEGIRRERRWWHKKTRLQGSSPGWATARTRSDIELRIDLSRGEDWRSHMGWTVEPEADWSDWQQSHLRLFRRGW